MHEKKLRDHQWIYYQLGCDFHVLKDLETSPIHHCHCYDELFQVAELLPAGDIVMPNETLTLEWFYKTFHKSERDQYIVLGQNLALIQLIKVNLKTIRITGSLASNGLSIRQYPVSIRPVTSSESTMSLHLSSSKTYSKAN